MPTLTKEVDGRTVTVTTDVPRELVTLRSQGFKDEAQTAAGLSELTVKDLRKELAAKQLPVAGSKAELVARLTETPAPAGVPTSTQTPASDATVEQPAETPDATE